MRRKYSLTALRAFESVGRTGSFARAAEELFVTRPAISKQIRLLEEEVGGTLFLRGSGHTTLTELGAELYYGVTLSFDLMSETMERVCDRAAGVDNLRILVEHDFATSWLASTIGEFLIAHPGISIDVVAVQNDLLHLSENFNYRIYYGDPAQETSEMLDRRELCRWIDLPLCAPDYPPHSDTPPPALAEVHLLHDRTREPWARWLKAAGLSDGVDIETGTIFNETRLCLSAAVSGTGAAIGDSFLAYPYIKEGTLVPLFALGLRSSDAYMLCRRQIMERSSAEREFESWITQAIAAHIVEVDHRLSELGVQTIQGPFDESGKT